MKISSRVEAIFSQAVALDQGGRFKNSIHVIRNSVFILNFDHTVLLRFRLGKGENPFSQSISFYANDYDGRKFYEEEGRVVFEKEEGGYLRKKSCGRAGFSSEEVFSVFRKRRSDFEKEKEKAVVSFSPSILGLLDLSLSHLEFSGKKGGSIRMIQRDIYTGSVIEVAPSEEKGLMGSSLEKKLDFDVGPLGLRTVDFQALFSFQKTLEFNFSPDCVFVKSLGLSGIDFSGFVSCCMYDELIQIKEVGEDGRKKPKIGRGK